MEEEVYVFEDRSHNLTLIKAESERDALGWEDTRIGDFRFLGELRDFHENLLDSEQDVYPPPAFVREKYSEFMEDVREQREKLNTYQSGGVEK